MGYREGVTQPKPVRRLEPATLFFVASREALRDPHHMPEAQPLLQSLVAFLGLSAQEALEIAARARLDNERKGRTAGPALDAPRLFGLAARMAWKKGRVEDAERALLTGLARHLGISPGEAAGLEKAARSQDPKATVDLPQIAPKPVAPAGMRREGEDPPSPAPEASAPPTSPAHAESPPGARPEPRPAPKVPARQTPAPAAAARPRAPGLVRPVLIVLALGFLGFSTRAWWGPRPVPLDPAGPTPSQLSAWKTHLETADAHVRENAWAQARSSLEAAVEAADRIPGPEGPSMGRGVARHRLALLLLYEAEQDKPRFSTREAAVRRIDEIVESFDAAIEDLLRTRADPKNPLPTVITQYARFLENVGRLSRAQEVRKLVAEKK